MARPEMGKPMEIQFACRNGHAWLVATGATVPPDQNTVSIPLAQLNHMICKECGSPAIAVRIRLR